MVDVGIALASLRTPSHPNAPTIVVPLRRMDVAPNLIDVVAINRLTLSCDKFVPNILLQDLAGCITGQGFGFDLYYCRDLEFRQL